MIVCSCAYVTDKDLEQAVLEVMSQPNAPLPTPGGYLSAFAEENAVLRVRAVGRRDDLRKMEDLEQRGLICPCACASAKTRMKDLMNPPERRVTRTLRDAPRTLPAPAGVRQKIGGASGSSL